MVEIQQFEAGKQLKIRSFNWEILIHKTPVRVIYKVKLKSSKTFSLKGTGWSKNLNPIFVYDGLYIVEEFWEERGEFGKLVFKFKLKRNLDQPKLPQRLEKKLLLSR
jgi:euchromatic histone-lysine N-methyltransferase